MLLDIGLIMIHLFQKEIKQAERQIIRQTDRHTKLQMGDGQIDRIVDWQTGILADFQKV